MADGIRDNGSTSEYHRSLVKLTEVSCLNRIYSIMIIISYCYGKVKKRHLNSCLYTLSRQFSSCQNHHGAWDQKQWSASQDAIL